MASAAPGLLRSQDVRGAFRHILAGVVFNRLFARPGGPPCVVLDEPLVPAHVAENLPGQTFGHATVSRSSSSGSTGRLDHGSSSLIAGSAAHPRGIYRRQLVARCRVLRADIRSFEDEFEAKHKRKPHSSGDRHLHSMQGVYAEYRQLKTLVRDNAALHIQILWKGFSTRKRLAAAGLMPSKRRAGLRAPAAAVVAPARLGAPAQLAPTSSLASSPATSLRSASALTSASGSAFALRASGSAPEPSGSAAAGARAKDAAGAAEPDAALAKLNQLKAEKSQLKARLRAYDTAFQQQHGRPVSANFHGQLAYRVPFPLRIYSVLAKSVLAKSVHLMTLA